MPGAWSPVELEDPRSPPKWPGKGGIYLMGDTALTRVKPQGHHS